MPAGRAGGTGNDPPDDSNDDSVAMVIGMCEPCTWRWRRREQNAPSVVPVIGGLLLATVKTYFFVTVRYRVMRRRCAERMIPMVGGPRMTRIRTNPGTAGLNVPPAPSVSTTILIVGAAAAVLTPTRALRLGWWIVAIGGCVFCGRIYFPNGGRMSTLEATRTTPRNATSRVDECDSQRRCCHSRADFTGRSSIGREGNGDLIARDAYLRRGS